MSLVECRTAADVRALAKARNQWRREQYAPKPAQPIPVPIQDLTPDAVAIEIARHDPQFEPAAPPYRPPYPKVAKIVEAVCRRFKVRLVDMHSQRRTKDVVLPRHVAMYLARRLTLCSLPQIGRELGGRDHTTILHGINKITALRQVNPKIDAAIIELEYIIDGGNCHGSVV